MSLEQDLQTRSDSKCELCASTDSLAPYAPFPRQADNLENTALICSTCREQIELPEKIDVHHWHCLNESMWTPVPAVQVMAWRMLQKLRNENWAADLLENLFLDDEVLAWAKESQNNQDAEEQTKHLDSNGTELSSGDTVTLIKDLDVKGANFVAKQGTTVKGITLVEGNPEQIEGRVSGQRIVILTKFVKKAKG